MISKIYDAAEGVPRFEEMIFKEKKNKYCLCIPIINEGQRILLELSRGKKANISEYVDIVLCDGGSTDGSMEIENLKSLNVNTLLTKKDYGKQSVQLRMGFWWALQRGYEGIITIDGNNKDSIEDVPKFVEKLQEGYDFVQGSRYVKGGEAINTPKLRHFAVKLIHAPIISLTARHKFTDTTNAYRAYSKAYLLNDNVKPFRDIFQTYELLAYLSTRATQIGLKVCEVAVIREYPKKGKTPTKISFFKGNSELFKILIKNMLGGYNAKS